MSIAQKSHVKSAVLHKVRWLASVHDDAAGHQTVEEVDSEVGSLVLQGYRLVNTHYIGSRKDATSSKEAFGVMYIFVLDTTELERLKQDINKRVE